ncbi:MAG: sortase [Chloroflexi bacterium]|nr:sortase [Chloroflexota bacterium]
MKRLFLILLALSLSTLTAAAGNTPSITIPSVNISASIVEFPLARGTWAIDPWERRVGHLEGTAGLADAGNKVLGGHSTLPNGKPGIFANLSNVAVGDEVVVFDGVEERRYTVSQVFTVSADDVSVVLPTPGERLTLITCDTGSYNRNSQLYDRRVVVIAERAG